MKILMMSILTALLLVCLVACADQNDKPEVGASDKVEKQAEKAPESVAQAGDEEYLESSRAATRKLGGALKTALQAAMKEGGPASALNVCHDEAEFIAQQICDEEGLTVGRTSRKFRNPGNEPDAWELAGLEAFSSRIAGGEDPRDMEMWATIAGPGGDRTFRYLKAIPTAPLCLKCHGENLSPELGAQLAELYPEDRALGFAAGDMRGAFSVKLNLSP